MPDGKPCAAVLHAQGYHALAPASRVSAPEET